MNTKSKPNQIINLIPELLLDKKAKDIMVLDVKKITTLTDFFIICTSESNPQTKALKDHVYRELRALGQRPLNMEGSENSGWIVLDYFNIIIHIFSKEQRDYYQIERLWGDAKIIKIKNES